MDGIFTSVGLMRIVRYGCGGFTIVVLLCLAIPSTLEPLGKIVAAVGGGVAIGAVLVVGVINYVLVRHALGVVLLYPFIWSLNWLFHERGKVEFEKVRASHSLASRLGAPFGSRNAVCGTLRARAFDKRTRDHLDLVHSELHVLWIAAIDVLVVGAFAEIGKCWWIVGGIVLLALTIRAEMSQDLVLCARLKAIGKAELMELMKDEPPNKKVTKVESTAQNVDQS